jgi:transposase-like protein
MNNQRWKFSTEFKTKVALEALKEQKTLSQLAEQLHYILVK